MKVALRLAERFYSIQGEGRYAGTPAYFIRFAGCNLLCNFGGYECDTVSVWKTTKEIIEPKKLVEDIVSKQLPSTTHIIITGGEPTLQKNALNSLVDSLKLNNFHIELESNGTVKDYDIYTDFNTINLSPKLQSAGYGFDWYDRKGLIDFWKDYLWVKPHQKSNIYFKFVVTPEHIDRDIEEILKWEKEVKINKSNIYVMPASITREDLIKNSFIVAETAKNYGWNFSPRLQLLIWDRATGV